MLLETRVRGFRRVSGTNEDVSARRARWTRSSMVMCAARSSHSSRGHGFRCALDSSRDSPVACASCLPLSGVAGRETPTGRVVLTQEGDLGGVQNTQPISGFEHQTPGPEVLQRVCSSLRKGGSGLRKQGGSTKPPRQSPLGEKVAPNGLPLGKQGLRDDSQRAPPPTARPPSRSRLSWARWRDTPTTRLALD